MKFSRGLFITLAAISFIGSSIGCYTLLKHPRVQTDERSSLAHDETINFSDNCSGCHSLGSLRAHHPAVPLPRRIVSPVWDYYYDDPWWRPYYTPVAGDSPTEEQKKRPFDRRHLSGQDENNSPAANAPEPASNPGTITKPADSGNGSAKPQPQDTDKREEKRSGDNKSSDRRTRKP